MSPSIQHDSGAPDQDPHAGELENVIGECLSVPPGDRRDARVDAVIAMIDRLKSEPGRIIPASVLKEEIDPDDVRLKNRESFWNVCIRQADRNPLTATGDVAEIGQGRYVYIGKLEI